MNATATEPGPTTAVARSASATDTDHRCSPVARSNTRATPRTRPRNSAPGSAITTVLASIATRGACATPTDHRSRPDTASRPRTFVAVVDTVTPLRADPVASVSPPRFEGVEPPAGACQTCFPSVAR